MIDLHETLSEFSYSYGVTRETEKLFNSVGIRTVPFLPSLLHEAELGFDVGFHKPGAVLLLQFELGHSVERFRRSNPTDPIPYLERPFWRFWINTDEINGQYETLLSAENDGAEVYYLAPKFTSWLEYLNFYENDNVLNESLMFKPSDIRRALDRTGAADGWHRIVYDSERVYVCSEPVSVERTRISDLIQRTDEIVSSPDRLLQTEIANVFSSLERRSSFRRDAGFFRDEAQHRELASLPEDTGADRSRTQRLERIRHRARTESDALAAALGIEAWSLGIQMILATRG